MAVYCGKKERQGIFVSCKYGKREESVLPAVFFTQACLDGDFGSGEYPVAG